MLTIAGSDSAGGAGLQADLRTFSAFGLHGAVAVTAVTVQDSASVHEVHVLPAAVVARQVLAVVADLRVVAAKTGMLASAETVSAVAAALTSARSARALPLVVDPVVASTSRRLLLAADAIPRLRAELLPLADVLTPNLHEAAILLDLEPDAAPRWGKAEREDVARRLLDLGPRSVLLKGGHSAIDADSADVLVDSDGVAWLASPRLRLERLHGTGCVLSAAIAAGLGGGLAVAAAVANARQHVQAALREAVRLGAASVPGTLGAGARMPCSGVD